LEDVERQLLSQSSTEKQVKKMLTLEEIEAQLIAAKPLPAPQLPQEVSTEQLMFIKTVQDLELRKRELGKQLELKKKVNDGLMTAEEKDQVAKIQLAQLANDPNLQDDFYNRRRVWKSEHEGDSKLTISKLKDSSSGSTNTETEQQKYQNMLSEVKKKAKPKQNQLEIRGALGKVAIYTLTNPKQQIKITAADFRKELLPSEKQQLKYPKYLILKTIESIYLNLIAIDELFIQWQQQQQTSDSVSAEENAEQQLNWNKNYTSQVSSLKVLTSVD
jgi:hypothetical protein